MTKGTIEMRVSIGGHTVTIPPDEKAEKAIVRVGAPHANWEKNQFFDAITIHHGELDADPITINIGGVETSIKPGQEGQIPNKNGDAMLIYRHDKLTPEDTKP